MRRRLPPCRLPFEKHDYRYQPAVEPSPSVKTPTGRGWLHLGTLWRRLVETRVETILTKPGEAPESFGGPPPPGNAGR